MMVALISVLMEVNVLLIRHIIDLFVLLYQYKYCFYTIFLPDVVSMDGDDDSEWLHRGQLTQKSEKTGTSYLQFDIITRFYMWTCNTCFICFIRIAGGDVLVNSEINGEAINDSSIDITIDGGKCAINPKCFCTTNW
jgi:hypothetical protein